MCNNGNGKDTDLATTVVAWRILSCKEYKRLFSFNDLLCFWNVEFSVVIK